MPSLTGKSAFVTAAGQGIGRATVLALAAAGARVIATDVDQAKLAGLESDLIRPAVLDVLDPAAVTKAAGEAGAVDILFNCAGYVHQGTLLEASEADWSFGFDLNCRSMFRIMQAFLPGMLARGGGVILNMASVASSLKGVPNRFIYSATKAAVIGMKIRGMPTLTTMRQSAKNQKLALASRLVSPYIDVAQKPAPMAIRYFGCTRVDRRPTTIIMIIATTPPGDSERPAQVAV